VQQPAGVILARINASVTRLSMSPYSICVSSVVPGACGGQSLTNEGPMNTSVPAQEEMEPRRIVWWHYERGEQETTSCLACCLGGEYLFRPFASAGAGDVCRFADAADLLNRHAAIERQLFAAGWHLVRFMHQPAEIPAALRSPTDLPTRYTIVDGRLQPSHIVRVIQNSHAPQS
jgi:hypothetical protein